MKLTELIAEEVTNAFYKHEGAFPNQLEHKTAAAITARLHECVKPLEWEDGSLGDNSIRETADCLFGTYEVLRWTTGDFGWTAPRNGRDNDEFGGLGSLEAAKAKAQAHYAAQIIEGLDL